MGKVYGWLKLKNDAQEKMSTFFLNFQTEQSGRG